MNAAEGARYPDLRGKTAVVTGASRGIGAATAAALAAQGVQVMLSARDAAALSRQVDAIREAGGTAAFHPADLMDEGSTAGLLEAAERTFGAVHLVAAIAGGDGAPSSVMELPPAEFRRIVDANLTSTFVTLKTFLPPMVGRGEGSIVVMSSTSGRIRTPANPAYGAAKAGLLMLMRQAAAEVAGRGVRINALAPGAVLTEKWEHAPQEIRERVAAGHPLGRLGTPADIAAAAVFLLSDASSWVTGATLDISGGMVMG
ncbi:MAG TPA: SDR family NAD(P)-dependent oxidoreductase [Micrococcaceae bacterium]|nr:SDR family NAD(P)-dependent oxidoreductase [Micrococcaceae bacterium]